MMSKQEALEVLRDFFNKQPPFDEAAHLVGHASSQIPSVFFHWLKGVSPQNRQALADAWLKSFLRGMKSFTTLALLRHFWDLSPRDIRSVFRQRALTVWNPISGGLRISGGGFAMKIVKRTTRKTIAPGGGLP